MNTRRESPVGPGRVLIIEPASSGTALVGAARGLGFETVVASFDADDRTVPDRVRQEADEVLVVDTNDEEALFLAAASAHGASPFAGVLAGFEFYVPVAARLAARLGLPGLPVDTVEGVRDKAVMRAATAAAGLRVPRFAEVSTEAQVAQAAARVGFPCVLKPVDSAGSVHVTRADDVDHLLAAYRELAADDRPDMGRRTEGRALVEEYLDGPELSVEGCVGADGRTVVVAVTHKVLGPEPSFVEIGHVVRADLPPATRRAVEDYVGEVVDALRVTVGPFHCELRLVAGEPVLIELAARLGGDRIPDLVEAATGVRLPELAVAALTGLDAAALPSRAPRAKYAGIRFLTASGEGGRPTAEGLARIAGWPGVLESELTHAADTPVPGDQDYRSRVGHVLYTADSYQDALDLGSRITLGVSLALPVA
ncbi:ATP-grasp domain-containing protein [Kitasatospora sp. NPDC089797]|uniref:ATP-grasp domain-containing protein n=1 Tax=Kitasatospora sp. NPDC089797 TaxID=3155298 RepID=UPI00343A8A21